MRKRKDLQIAVAGTNTFLFYSYVQTSIKYRLLMSFQKMSRNAAISFRSSRTSK